MKNQFILDFLSFSISFDVSKINLVIVNFFCLLFDADNLLNYE